MRIAVVVAALEPAWRITTLFENERERRVSSEMNKMNTYRYVVKDEGEREKRGGGLIVVSGKPG